MEPDLKLYPIEIHNFIERKGDTDLGIIVTSRGGLDSILNIVEDIRKKGYKITHLEWSEEMDENNTIFMILSEALKDAENIMGVIKQKSEVINVEVAPTFGNYIYCPFFFPIRVSGQRAILFEKELLTKFMKNLYEMFIPDMIRSFLFHVGKAYGYGLYDYYKSFKGNDELGYLIDFIRIVGLLSGGGIIEKYEYRGGEIRLHVRYSMECETYRDLGLDNRSSFLKGILESIFERHLSSKVVVKVEECIASGHHRCIFSITPLKPS